MHNFIIEINVVTLCIDIFVTPLEIINKIDIFVTSKEIINRKRSMMFVDHQSPKWKLIYYIYL